MSLITMESPSKGFFLLKRVGFQVMFRERELDEEGEREERDEEREEEGAPRIARPLVTNWFVVLITMMKMDIG